ncbi:MAG: hypothetical protein LUF82_05105 [Clostridia bacterium]|nr:hypothetical protein [Clostridia bacterium]MCD8040876.1 hypothetical protein [Clostridia bacterium]
MAENENVLQPEVEQPEAKPAKVKKSKGGFKEWLRKQTVNLKRKPQNIPFVFYLVACVVYLVALTNFSKCVTQNYGNDQTWSALCVFGCTLFSLLAIVAYMRIFPKHKKASIPMMVVTYVFTAMLIFFDIVFYNEITGLRAINDVSKLPYASADTASLAIAIVHIVLLAIGAVLLATLPLWRKLLMKINTRKEVESAAGNVGEIDLQDAD